MKLEGLKRGRWYKCRCKNCGADGACIFRYGYTDGTGKIRFYPKGISLYDLIGGNRLKADSCSGCSCSSVVEIELIPDLKSFKMALEI